MVGVRAQRADASHVEVAVKVGNALTDVLSERGTRHDHTPSVVEALRRLIVRGSDVVDLRSALVIVDEQIKLYCRRERGLAVLAPHDPKHLAVLARAIGVNEPEDNREDRPLEKLKLEVVAQASRRQAAEPLDELNVLLRVFLSEVVRVKRVGVVHVAQDVRGNLAHLGTGGYIAA